MADLSGCIIVGPGGVEYRLSPITSKHHGLSQLRGADLGMAIKRLREAKGFKQRAFAKKIGLTHAQLNRIEMGKVNKPQARVIEAIELGLS